LGETLFTKEGPPNLTCLKAQRYEMKLISSRYVFIAGILTAFLAASSFQETHSARADDPDLVREKASHIFLNLIQGTFDGDYGAYSQDFSSAMKRANDRESFLLLQRNLQKNLGKFKTMEYLGSYRQLGQTITLFKAQFGKEKDDVLVKLVLDEKDGEFKVTGLWFDSPALEK